MLKKIIPILVFTMFILHSTFSILHSSEINLPKTGQTTSYGTGDAGAIKAGQPWPAQRFTAANGAVTDNLTGLIWLQNANCAATLGGVTRTTTLPWADALTWSNALASPACGLSDGSTAGQWRLPTKKELQSLVDSSKSSPALPAGHPFSNVQSTNYLSSSTYAGDTAIAWSVGMGNGYVVSNPKTFYYDVWPVRGGQ